MNSSYGKTALKETNEDHMYIAKADFNKHVSRHYNWIKEITPTADGRGFRVKQVKATNTRFNRVHIGIQVLSMSKRIMNGVMCLAEDMAIPMFYQDADSIHMYSKDVTPLSDAFRVEHNRKLVGSDMGNFHTDFDLGDCKDIYSERCITLGEKCYVDALVGVNKQLVKWNAGTTCG